MMPVGPASSPSGVFRLSEAFFFEKAPEQVPSELPKVSETFLTCPVMLGPNITGEHRPNGVCGWVNAIVTGAFGVGSYKLVQDFNNSGADAAYPMTFDASRSNSIYGSSSVQPLSLRTLPCIKL